MNRFAAGTCDRFRLRNRFAVTRCFSPFVAPTTGARTAVATGGIMGALHRLSEKTARGVGPGRYADGGGLYLQVRKTEDEKGLRRSWIFKCATGQVVLSKRGKRRRAERELGLGSYPDIGLADARERALEARKKRANGVGPARGTTRCQGRQAARGGSRNDLQGLCGHVHQGVGRDPRQAFRTESRSYPQTGGPEVWDDPRRPTALAGHASGAAPVWPAGEPCTWPATFDTVSEIVARIVVAFVRAATIS
jgi:hypothetical protein